MVVGQDVVGVLHVLYTTKKRTDMGKPDKGDEDIGNVVKAAARNIFTNPDEASLKRVAWAFGCIREGSEEEEKLLAILRAKLEIPTA
jgi:hypothetical protein